MERKKYIKKFRLACILYLFICLQQASPFSFFFCHSSFSDIPFPFPFARLSWVVVHLLFCNNTFLNIRIFFFVGTRHFYVPPDNVVAAIMESLCCCRYSFMYRCRCSLYSGGIEGRSKEDADGSLAE